MKRRTNISIATLLTLSLTVYGPLGASAGTGARDSTGGARAAPVQGNFSEDELDELLAPIALYPDPILAQVLPASTFVEQLDEASRMLGGRVNENLIEKQNWDVSVKSIAHYPEVLQMMTQDKDWTIALGQAVINQTPDVMKSVQRLRAEAKAAGNLASNDKMTVGEESDGQAITIEPAQPQVIYVPQYNPSVVYDDDDVSVGGAVAASLISFGTGFVIGSWLNRRMNWWGWGFPYHGWIGGGWIGRSRPFVNTHNNFYVNNRFRNSNLNRNILRRDISSYRGGLRRDAALNRQRLSGARLDRPGRTRDLRDRSTINDKRVDALRNRDRDRNRLDAYSGRDVRRPIGRPSTGDAAGIKRPVRDTRDIRRPAAGTRELKRPSGLGSNSAFGGYQNNRAVKMQHDRGGFSRAQMNRGGHGAGVRRGGGSGAGVRRGGGGFGGGGRRGGGGFGRGRRG